MTNAIQALCESGDMLKAINLYSQVSFSDTINKARKGNQFAILYTFYTARKMVAYYMWKGVFGSKKYFKKNIMEGKDYDYLSEVMCMLPKALASFKETLYDKEEFCIRGWNQWMLNYIRMAKRGMIEKENIISLNVTIYDGDYNPIKLEDLLEDQRNSFDDDLHNSMKIESFHKILSDSEKELFAYIYKGYSVPEIAKHFGVSRQTIYVRIDTMKAKYKEINVDKR